MGRSEDEPDVNLFDKEEADFPSTGDDHGKKIINATVVPVAQVPEAALSNIPMKSDGDITDEQLEILRDQGFTTGLARAMAKNSMAFPLRIWVVDNSGSMQTADGNRLVDTHKPNDVRVVKCTRWAEIQQTVEYHIRMAALLKAPTIFRMLNNPGKQTGPRLFGVAHRSLEHNLVEQDVDVALRTIRSAEPRGVTPLTDHIREIRATVASLAPGLDGGKVVIVLATDGLPTDNRGVDSQEEKREFINALRSLEGLPVWVVVRLCTDNPKVVKFYNELDAELELSVEVIDDFFKEAKEVYCRNKWLNYALPLYRCREMGFHHRLMDFMDERRLSKAELQDFCCLLLGETAMDGLPDAEVDTKEFVKAIEDRVQKEKPQWNPNKKRMTPWIDIRALKRAFGVGSRCSIL